MQNPALLSHPFNATQPEQPQDSAFMQQAIALAKRGQYTTRPNPAVGCVIVQNNMVVGQGFHPKAGQPHAEVFALREAGELAIGATAYVTLEPCAHFGKTPPCANALVSAGVQRVVVATLDANPQVSGQGIAILQQAGISVTLGVCEAEARALNAGFLKHMATGLPYVRLKVAASLDGRTAMANGESKWITGAAARQDVQHFRAISGAIITGINTVLADNPSLNVRGVSDGTALDNIPQPLRVILDRAGQLPLDAKILQPAPEALLVSNNPPQGLVDNIEVWHTQALGTLLQQLAKQKQIHDVLIEAGATLSAAFIAENLVDELIVYLAPTVLGCDAKPMFKLPFMSMTQQKRFKISSLTQVGDDIRLILHPRQ